MLPRRGAASLDSFGASRPRHRLTSTKCGQKKARPCTVPGRTPRAHRPAASSPRARPGAAAGPRAHRPEPRAHTPEPPGFCLWSPKSTRPSRKPRPRRPGCPRPGGRRGGRPTRRQGFSSPRPLPRPCSSCRRLASRSGHRGGRAATGRPTAAPRARSQSRAARSPPWRSEGSSASRFGGAPSGSCPRASAGSNAAGRAVL
mmetsp:Transcript_22783/g.51391  ORF Transcript_22783/g.51391 Transcript_22783/m.51391 type:complete len:201 (-) Transcript_22783:394-996(-)